MDWFEQQDEAYRRTVLPPEVKGQGRGGSAHPMSWYAGSATPARSSASTTWASADYKTLIREVRDQTSPPSVAPLGSSLEKTKS